MLVNITYSLPILSFVVSLTSIHCPGWLLRFPSLYVSAVISDTDSGSPQLFLTWILLTNISLLLNGTLAFSHNVCSFIYIILTELMKVGVIYLSSQRWTYQTVYRFPYSQALVTKLNISAEWFLYGEVWFTGEVMPCLCWRTLKHTVVE